MNAFLLFMNLLGALGIFLFGMKVMSEALQRVAGSRLQGMLNTITGNRFSAVVTGFMTTSVVQSSSATTVMVVGFVSAGLLSLTQAIGVIMGANIGTTITGWLVALLGFKVKITSFALPAAGVGVAMTAVRNTKVRYWGEVLLGFGLLFLGLALLKDSVPDLSEEQLLWVNSLSGRGMLSTLTFIALGTGLTVVLQSSSATMALTLTMTIAGYLPYDGAMAMILGENIGTTVTANIAAVGTQAAARRAARAHFVFNIIGATWAALLMGPVMMPLIDAIVPGDPVAAMASGDRVIAATMITSHLAMFHTVFNITNTLVMLPFVHQLAALVTRWIPEDEVPEWSAFTTHISSVLPQTPELTIVQVKHEMQHMAEVLGAMNNEVFFSLTHPLELLGTRVEDAQASEQLTDELELAIGEVLTHVSEAGLSEEAAEQIRGMAGDTHRMERIGDHIKRLMGTAARQHESEKRRMSPESLAFFTEVGEDLKKTFADLAVYLGPEGTHAQAEALMEQIRNGRKVLRKFSKSLLKSEERGTKGLILTMDAVHVVEDIYDRLRSISYVEPIVD
ncbi:MAG: Na/Pi cotransporter family protein [Proteobacteria bacterium]|nr:Na/Pi cotransporter family protein [Pseudomonadota bacterium]